MSTAWLYTLQQHTALTRLERTTLATLVLLVVGGVVAQNVRQMDAAPVDPTLFAAEAAAVAVATAAPDSAVAARQDSIATAARADVARELAAARAIDKATEASSGEGGAKAVGTSRGARAAKAAFTGRLNLNTATATELEQLPRVGPALAARIVAYRVANGGFRRPADLTNVKGIGEKTLEKLLPHVVV